MVSEIRWEPEGTVTSTAIYTRVLTMREGVRQSSTSKVIRILYKIGIVIRDINIIKNLYCNENAAIKIEEMNSEIVAMKCCDRKCFVLSSMLFNLYPEMAFKEELHELEQYKIRYSVIA